LPPPPPPPPPPKSEDETIINKLEAQISDLNFKVLVLSVVNLGLVITHLVR
jgi:hypothetical protein